MRRAPVIRRCPVCRRQVKVGAKFFRHLDKVSQLCPMSGRAYTLAVPA